MEQMNTDGLEVVSIDLEASDIPISVKDFHPTVFKDGAVFCCILGPDPKAGVFGCGNTVAQALSNFDRQLQLRRDNPVNGDPVSDYIQQRHI